MYARIKLDISGSLTEHRELPLPALRQLCDEYVADVVAWLEDSVYLSMDKLDAVDILALRYHVRKSGKMLYYEPALRLLSWTQPRDAYQPYCTSLGKPLFADHPAKLHILDELLSHLA